jgi:hypothetical protein
VTDKEFEEYKKNKHRIEEYEERLEKEDKKRQLASFLSWSVVAFLILLPENLRNHTKLFSGDGLAWVLASLLFGIFLDVVSALISSLSDSYFSTYKSKKETIAFLEKANYAAEMEIQKKKEEKERERYKNVSFFPPKNNK